MVKNNILTAFFIQEMQEPVVSKRKKASGKNLTGDLIVFKD